MLLQDAENAPVPEQEAQLGTAARLVLLKALAHYNVLESLCQLMNILKDIYVEDGKRINTTPTTGKMLFVHNQCTES